MTDTAHQIAGIAAVRVMTGKTIDPAHLLTKMLRLQPGTLLMTIEAQIAADTLEQTIVVTAVSGMTTAALSVTEWRVADLIISLGGFMALEAERSTSLFQQLFLLRSVRVMTAGAIPIAERGVEGGLRSDGFRNLLVTLQAEFPLWLQKQLIMS